MQKIKIKSIIVTVIMLVVFVTIIYGMFLFNWNNSNDNSDNLIQSAVEEKVITELDVKEFGVVKVIDYPSAKVLKVVRFDLGKNVGTIDVIDYTNVTLPIKDIVTIDLLGNNKNFIKMNIWKHKMGPSELSIIKLDSNAVISASIGRLEISDDSKYVISHCVSCIGGCSNDIRLYIVNDELVYDDEYNPGIVLDKKIADASEIKLDGHVLQYTKFSSCGASEGVEKSINLDKIAIDNR